MMDLIGQNEQGEHVFMWMCAYESARFFLQLFGWLLITN